MSKYFSFQPHLQIAVPVLNKEFEDYSVREQEKILAEWEKIRGSIPDIIKKFEIQIENKLEQLNQEMDFENSCQINSDISELASKINDLWIWYRMEQKINN